MKYSLPEYSAFNNPDNPEPLYSKKGSMKAASKKGLPNHSTPSGSSTGNIHKPFVSSFYSDIMGTSLQPKPSNSSAQNNQPTTIPQPEGTSPSTPSQQPPRMTFPTTPGADTPPRINVPISPGYQPLPRVPNNGISAWPGNGTTTTPGLPTSPGTTIPTTPGIPTRPGNGMTTPTTPGMPARPGNGMTTPTTPGMPARPGNGMTTPTTPGMPARPGNGMTTPTTPGMPARPGNGMTTPTTPGMPARPGNGMTTPTTPGMPSIPGNGMTTPGMPSIPGTAPITPGAPTFPGSAPMTPAMPFQPGTTSNRPQGSNSNIVNKDKTDYNNSPFPNYWSGDVNMTDTSPYRVPLGVPMMPLYGYDNCEDADKDLDYMKQMYPLAAKKILAEIEEECDKLEYDGSCMFDEYPDRVYLSRIIDRIYAKCSYLEDDTLTTDSIKTVEHSYEEEEQTLQSKQYEPRRFDRRRDRRWDNRQQNWLRNLIEVLLFNELLHRRRRYRGRTRWF